MLEIPVTGSPATSSHKSCSPASRQRPPCKEFRTRRHAGSSAAREPLFAALDADSPGELDAVNDLANMPLATEPQQVRDDLDAVRTRQ